MYERRVELDLALLRRLILVVIIPQLLAINSATSSSNVNSAHFRNGHCGFVSLTFEHDEIAEMIAVRVHAIDNKLWHELRDSDVTTLVNMPPDQQPKSQPS